MRRVGPPCYTAVMSHRRPPALLALCLSVAAPTLAAPPGAYDLLERVRNAYAGLASYHDIGEIERLVEPAAEGGAPQRQSMWFETAAQGDRFRWDLWIEGEMDASQQVLWRAGSEAFHYDGLRRQYKPVASLPGALARVLGEGGMEALVVPLLLAGSEAALGDPEAASVEGPEDCDRLSCWVVSLSRMNGAVASRLWIDRDAFLIRRLEVEISGAAEIFGRAADEAGLAPASGFAGRAMRFRVEHVVEAPGETVEAERLAFRPPAAAQRVEEWQAVTAPPDDAGEPPEYAFYDEITVALHTFTARIVDSRGDPLRGLSPEDLEARAGGREIPITALDWVSSLPPEGDPWEAETPGGGAPERRRGLLETVPELPSEPAGKWVALFVQADFEPTVARGHLRLLPAVEEMVDGLPRDDRVAVFSFYRSLRLWQDFSRDREATVAALEKAILPGAEPLLRRSDAGPLTAHFDFREARRATSPERALELVAEAMTPLSGEKVVIYVGWSLGHLRTGGVSMDPDYLPALRALDAARATVFVLDVSEADWHALEVGLQQVAEDTGGTYHRTFRFTAQEAHRLARTISGHYLVTIDRSGAPDARGRLRLALAGRKGTVLMKPILLR